MLFPGRRNSCSKVGSPPALISLSSDRFDGGIFTASSSEPTSCRYFLRTLSPREIKISPPHPCRALVRSHETLPRLKCVHAPTVRKNEIVQTSCVTTALFFSLADPRDEEPYPLPPRVGYAFVAREIAARLENRGKKFTADLGPPYDTGHALKTDAT